MNRFSQENININYQNWVQNQIIQNQIQTQMAPLNQTKLNSAIFNIQIVNNYFKMSIFAINSAPVMQPISQRSSKVEKFRQQIRRKQQEQKFAFIRKQFIQSLKSLNFLHELNSQKDNITAKKIDWIVNGLEGGQNNVTFYQDIMDLQLQSCLCQLLFDEGISLSHKNKIMKSLIQLTYFTHNIPKDFLQNNLIDYMRVELAKIQLQNEEQSLFAFDCANLVLNLTAFRDQQFNDFMVQSDFLPNLQKLVDKPTYSQKANDSSVQIRVILLKIYSILFQTSHKKIPFVSKTLKRLLNDTRNYQERQPLNYTLLCLVQTTKIQKFWQLLQKGPINQNGAIYYGFSNIIDEISQEFHYESFRLVVQFLTELFESEDIVRQQANLYINNLPQQFLINCIFQLQKNEKVPKHRKILGSTVKMLSYVKTLHNNVYRNKIQQQEFITAIMVRYVATNCLFAKYLVKVLCKILEQDKTTIDIMINNGIIDMIRDYLDSDFFKQQKIEVIDLIEKLIYTEQQMRNKDQSENRMLNVFYHRSIISDIQKLQDDQVPEVYRRAQIFMTKLSQMSSNLQDNKK